MKTKIYSKSLIAAGLALLAAACNTPAPEVPDQTAKTLETPPAIAKLVDKHYRGQAHVKKVFDGPGDLVGLIIELGDVGSGVHDMAYATADGQYILYGAVAADESGINPAAKYADQLGISRFMTMRLTNFDNSANVDERYIADLESMVVEVQGSGPRVIYVMVDPQCPHCRVSFKEFQNPMYQKQLTVKWVMASTVGGSFSANKAALVSSKKLKLESAMTGPGPASAEEYDQPLISGAEEYKAKGDAILDGGVRVRAVPAVIASRNGKWIARTGFAPTDYILGGSF